MVTIHKKVDKLEKQVIENTKNITENTTQLKTIWNELKNLKTILLKELKTINLKLDKPKSTIWQIILYLLAGGMITMLISMVIFS